TICARHSRTDALVGLMRLLARSGFSAAGYFRTMLLIDSLLLSQKINLKPNCISRGSVVVLVMRPAVWLILPLEKIDMFGMPRFTTLGMLKNSARNSKVWLSRIGVVLNKEKSTSVMPGP